jgi:3-hydroxybutyryl-CoA dehydratase
MVNSSVLCQIGDKASLSRTITDKDIHAFADLVGDHNPIHLNDEYALGTRFKGRVAHGVLAIGLISAVLGNELPGPGTIYLRQTVDFIKPVRPGDTITAIVEVVDIKPEKPILSLRTYCVNQTEQVVLEGEAVVLFEG